MKSLYDIRRDNLRQLIETRFDGSQTKLAKAVGLKQPSFVSRLLTDRQGTRKNIGNRLARRIEEALALSANFLDAPESEPQIGLRFSQSLSAPLADRSVASLGKIDDDNQGVLLLDAEVLGQFDSISSARMAPPEGTERIATHGGASLLPEVALRLPDDSMAERFPAGSIVVIADLSHGPNDFVVGVLPGTGKACMRQRIEVADRSFLVPLNRAYQAVEVTPDFKLLGVVVEAILFF